tara:strand:- start:98 stop:307 length:210 start_codon:yes stop_codon:yes gene_type:complete
MVDCEVCKTEIPFTVFETISDARDGCMTDLGAVCKKCIRNWLADYLQMVNPFLHLEGKKVFKIRRKENE